MRSSDIPHIEQTHVQDDDTEPTGQGDSKHGISDAMTLASDKDAQERNNQRPEETEENTKPPGSAEEGNGPSGNILKEKEQRPPLPPRPSLLKTGDKPGEALSTGAKPTTALSSVDIQTLSFPDGSRGTFSTPASRSVSQTVSFSESTPGQSTPSRKVSRNGSFDDGASLMSYAPTLKANGDLASLLDDGLNSQSPAWKLLSSQAESVNPFENIEFEDNALSNFEHEFDEIEALDSQSGNEGWSFSFF